MKAISIISLMVVMTVSFLSLAGIASTPEVSANSFWSDFEITFLQTFPFATLGGYFLERQFSSLMFPGSAVHWNAILTFAGVVSAANAFYTHAHSTRTSRR